MEGDRYYALLGSDVRELLPPYGMDIKTGVPLPNTLKSLGLENIILDLCKP